MSVISKAVWSDSLSLTREGRNGISVESLSTIIRSNLAIHYGKTLDVELMQNITQHIVESIDYVLNKK